jgi:hypothetical protein
VESVPQAIHLVSLSSFDITEIVELQFFSYSTSFDRVEDEFRCDIPLDCDTICSGTLIVDVNIYKLRIYVDLYIISKIYL